jgi:hypothetical protein
LVAFSVGFFLSSCNFATPENYFDKAVLNVNPITPFAGQAAFNSSPQPSVKLVPGTKDQTAPMASREIVINQMQSAEGNFGKLDCSSPHRMLLKPSDRQIGRGSTIRNLKKTVERNERDATQSRDASWRC